VIPSATIFTVLLLIAGIGSGLVLGAASAATSNTDNPDRSANIAMIFNRLMVALAFFTVPLIGGSITAVLLVLAIPGVIVLFTVRWLPKPPASSIEYEAPSDRKSVVWGRRGEREREGVSKEDIGVSRRHSE